MNALYYYVFAATVYSVLRITVYMVSSNIYTLRYGALARRNTKAYYRPTVSVIVPAHNEAAVIERTLDSLLASRYPRKRMEIIVANDGSTDNTAAVVRSYNRKHRNSFKLSLITRPNCGKAEALNYVIRKHTSGQLIICLDADSLVHPDCIKNAVQYFRDRRVVAAASNVNVIENGTLLGLAQRFEYLYSHQLKKAHTALNMEYIIGGVGSTFRKSAIKSVGYYDSNTMTEDIDLTLKLITLGNKANRIVFASDALTYTEPVLSYHGLITQRFRWKYGRLQSFLKNRQLFFNTQSRYSRQLTWFLLPVTVLYELLMLLEPLVIGFIIYLCLAYRDPSTIYSAALLFTVLVVLNVWLSDHLKFSDRLRLSLYAPAMCVFLYALSVVEYVAVVKSAFKIKGLPSSLRAGRTTWQSPTRSAKASL